MSHENQNLRDFDRIQDEWDPIFGIRRIRIDRPSVRQREITYDDRDPFRHAIKFEPGDVVLVVNAGGCVQTGGTRNTWKRYVDPKDNDDDKYFGLIKLPGMVDFIRILEARGQSFRIPQDAEPDNLFLKLGYADDDYGDNGYWGKDDGTQDQCKNESTAFLELHVKSMRLTNPIQPPVILETKFPAPTNRGGDWTRNLAGGHVWMKGTDQKFEWLSIRDDGAQQEGHIVGLSGTVLEPRISNADMPFTHPFGNDWEFYLVPDEGYTTVLGPSNKREDASTTPETQNAIDRALSFFPELAHAKNGIGIVEVDSGLVPQAFRQKPGDRVVIYGRWIVDCGHKDFHTEIHPPLLMANGRTNGPETLITLWSRPFLVDQLFGDDSLYSHFLNELAEVASPLIPFSTMIKAHPKLFSKPFARLSAPLEFDIRPPVPRRSAVQSLRVRYHFTVRAGMDIDFRQIPNDPDGLRVMVHFDPDAYPDAPEPKRIEKDYHDSDLELQDSIPGWVPALLGAVSLLGISNRFALLIFARGIRTHMYEWPLPPVDINDEDLTMSELSGSAIFDSIVSLSLNNDQPFPILGKLLLDWHDLSTGGGSPPD